MSDSVYRKTPLPVRLNLNDRNTKEQLGSGTPEESSRGTLEGVGLASTTASQSKQNCTEVMVKHLKEWMDKHEIKGPPPSADAEQRAMWQWIRDFHKEYNDDWFSRNMPRLHETFRPVFVGEIKRMKRQASAESPSQNAAPQTQKQSKNLLDFEEPAVAVSQATNAKAAPAQSDLLSLEEPTVKAASAAANTQGASGTTAQTGNNLLDLDFGGAPADPPKDASDAGAKDSNLLDLMM